VTVDHYTCSQRARVNKQVHRDEHRWDKASHLPCRTMQGGGVRGCKATEKQGHISRDGNMSYGQLA